MGACGAKQGSTEEEKARAAEMKKSKAIDKEVQQSQAKEAALLKLLLLGAGESGKSTLFKQMITIYGHGYTDEERFSFTDVVWNNTILAMKTLAAQTPRYGPIMPEHQPLIQQIAECSADKMTPEIASAIKALWQDPGVISAFNNRSKFQLIDSAPYFFNNIDRIAGTDYVPTDQDILRCRVRTTGIVEQYFTIKNNKFVMIDVGGQRNERKKWVHCFENVTAVLFVVALSEYDQVLYEDETTNRMEEAYKLFKETCSSKWFSKVSMILFFNKMDLFEEKIKRVDLNVCFKDYMGGCDMMNATAYLQSKFTAQDCIGARKIFCHFTTATDTENVERVFRDVSEIVIRKALEASELM